jgi:hypothetical protein
MEDNTFSQLVDSMNFLDPVSHDPHRSRSLDIIDGEAIEVSEDIPSSLDSLGVISMTSPSLSRRTAFVGAAALTLVPIVAAAGTAKQTTIAKLWADAEDLHVKISAYRSEIAAAAHNGGISGWMRLGGEANALGGLRYARLMAILNGKPENQADLAIMARVVLDEEIHNGAKGYAADQFAKATIGLNASVA